MGENRLIQVLAVYEEAQGDLSFFYGDAMKSLRNSREDVSILVSAVSASATAQGQVIGRYINSDGSTGPTGVLQARFNPGNSKPLMTVLRTSIVNGWFSIFGLKGLPFTYEVAGGPVLFSNVDISATHFPTSASVARVEVPQHATEQNGIYTVRQAESFIYGFWGPGAGSKTVCQQGFTGITSGRYRGATSPYNPLTIHTSGSPSSTVLFQGGGACGSTELVDHIKVRANTIENGKDSLAPFLGAFAYRFDGPLMKAYEVSFSGANATFSFDLLPGVNNQYFDKIQVYRKTLASSSSDFWFRGDYVPCDAIAAGKFPGFEPFASTSVSTSSSNLSVTAAITSADMQKSVFAFCPMKGTASLNAGMFSKGLGSTYCASCKYIRLEMNMNNSIGVEGQKYILGKDKCYTMKLKLYQNGNSTNLSSSLTVNNLNQAVGGGTVGSFYSDSGCAAALNSPTIAAGASGDATVYFKSATAASNVFFDPSSLTGAEANSVYFDSTQEFEIVTPVLALEMPSDMLTGVCYQAQIRSTLKGTFNFDSPATVNLSLNSGSVVNMFQSTVSCDGGVSADPTVSLTLATSQRSFYVRRATNASASITASADALFAASPVHALSSNTTGSIQAAKFKLVPAAAITAGACIPYDMILVNASGYEVPAVQTVTGSLATLQGGAYWSDSPYCENGNGIHEVMFANYMSRKRVYLRTQSPGLMVIVPGRGGYPVEVIGGSASGDGSAITVGAPATDKAFLYGDFPRFNTLVIGSHEFSGDNHKAIQLTVPVDSYVTCQKLTNPPIWDSGPACSSSEYDSVNRVLKWTVSDAVANFGYRISYWHPNLGSSDFRFVPERLYAINPSSKFVVKNCSVTLNSIGQNRNDIITAVSTYPVTCLGSGAFGVGTTAASIDLTANKWLIGKLGPLGGQLSTINANATNYLVTVASTASGDVGLANVHLSGNNANTLALYKVMDPAGNPNVVSTNNKYTVATIAGATGLVVYGANSYTFTSAFDEFNVVGASVSGSNNGVGIAGAIGSREFFRAKWVLDTTNSSFPPIAINADGSTTNVSNVFVRESFVSGEGQFAQIMGSAAPTTATITLERSIVNLLTGGQHASAAVIKSNGYLHVRHTEFVQDMDAPIFKLNHHLSIPAELLLENSVIRQARNYPVVERDANYPAISSVVRLNANHIIRQGGAGNTASVISANTSDLTVDSNIAIPVHGHNLLCGDSSGTNWVSPLSGTGNYTGTIGAINWASIQNGVSSGNRCSTSN